MNRHFILALSFLITTFSIAQSSTMLNLELTNTSAAHQEIVLKSNVTDLLVGRYSIGLEKGLNESLSFGIELDYLSRDFFWSRITLGMNHYQHEKRGSFSNLSCAGILMVDV